MWTRRQFLTRGAGSALVVGGLSPLRAGDEREKLPDGSMAKGMITTATGQAIDQGLNFLARGQDREGWFGTGHHRGNVAITSLAGLAFMAGGNHPGRGAFGRPVERALEYVLSQESTRVPGYLYGQTAAAFQQHDGPMYSHGFGTLFLAEVHGMVSKKALRDRLKGTLKRAVDLIVNSQNRKGGWRYYPESKDADISVTICQVMALRAARNAGFSVPKETVDRCIEYVKSCQEPASSKAAGGFRYMDQGGQPAFARTAAGVVALYCAGLYKDPAIEMGLKYLLHYKPTQYFSRPDMHYFYGHYYAAQAMWTAGGTYWAQWYPAVRDELLGRAYRLRQDGSWADQICTHYATAMACIILQIPNNLLPILQK